MLVLQTICHETIWGGQKLNRYSEKHFLKIGHLYSVYCRDTMSNLILNGKSKGKHLNDVFNEWKNEFRMAQYEHFPLTLALTEADENLSIQVHPDDQMAKSMEGEGRGKRESWYFLEAPLDGKIINGCSSKSRMECEKLIKAQDYLAIAGKIDVEEGDYVFVEPGTLHALTAGSLVYEIEEGADYTYRFYDYDRVEDNGTKRELHIEKALHALDINKKSCTQKYPENGEIAEKTYVTKKIQNINRYENLSEDLQCFTLIKGKSICDEVALNPGMTVLLWPGECINDAVIDLAFVAWIRRDII